MKLHAIEIEIPSVVRSATVKIDGRRVEGLLDFSVDVKDHTDSPVVTLKLSVRSFKLIADKAQIDVVPEDIHAGRKIRDEIDGGTAAQ